MKGADFLQDACIIRAWRIRLADQPSEYVAVRGFEQAFIGIELGIAQAGDLHLREATEQEIDLAHATMPGAEENLSAARVESGTHMWF